MDYTYLHYVLICLCVVALLLASYRGRKLFEHSQSWSLVPAEVLARSSIGGEPIVDRLKVRYIINGIERSAYLTSELLPSPPVGSQVLIRVNPERPENILLWTSDNG